MVLAAFAAVIGMLAVRRAGYGLAGLACLREYLAPPRRSPARTPGPWTSCRRSRGRGGGGGAVGLARTAAAAALAAGWLRARSRQLAGPPPRRQSVRAGSLERAPSSSARRPDRRRFLAVAARHGGRGRSRRPGRPGAARTLQRGQAPGRHPAARPRQAGRAGPRRNAAWCPGDHPVLHVQRQLLPGRHRAGPAAGPARGAGRCAIARDGRPAGRADLRGPAAPPAHRARHHAGLRLQPGRRPAGRERALARRAAWPTCSREAGVHGRRRPVLSAPPTTAGPAARRARRHRTAATRCSRSG